MRNIIVWLFFFYLLIQALCKANNGVCAASVKGWIGLLFCFFIVVRNSVKWWLRQGKHPYLLDCLFMYSTSNEAGASDCCLVKFGITPCRHSCELCPECRECFGRICRLRHSVIAGNYT